VRVVARRSVVEQTLTTRWRFGIDVLSCVINVLRLRVFVGGVADLLRVAAHLLSDAAEVAPNVLCFPFNVRIERISVVFALLSLH